MSNRYDLALFKFTYRYSTVLSKILKMKNGSHYLAVGNTLKLWLQEVCAESVPFQIGKSYHIQGRYGWKYVLDHNSLVEEWPETYNDSKINAEKSCSRAVCKGKGAVERKACLAKALKGNNCKHFVREECKYNKRFEMYLDKLAERGTCERQDICK